MPFITRTKGRHSRYFSGVVFHRLARQWVSWHLLTVFTNCLNHINRQAAPEPSYLGCYQLLPIPQINCPRYWTHLAVLKCRVLKTSVPQWSFLHWSIFRLVVDSILASPPLRSAPRSIQNHQQSFKPWTCRGFPLGYRWGQANVFEQPREISDTEDQSENSPVVPHNFSEFVDGTCTTDEQAFQLISNPKVNYDLSTLPVSTTI